MALRCIMGEMNNTSTMHGVLHDVLDTQARVAFLASVAFGVRGIALASHCRLS
jgi:hypothetical protein